MKFLEKYSRDSKVIKKYKSGIFIGALVVLLASIGMLSSGRLIIPENNKSIWDINNWESSIAECEDNDSFKQDIKYINGPLGVDCLANKQIENKEKAIKKVKDILGKDATITMKNLNYKLNDKEYYLIDANFGESINKTIKYCIDKSDLKVFLFIGKNQLYPYNQQENNSNEYRDYGVEEY